MKTKKALLALLLLLFVVSASWARVVTPVSPQTENWAKRYAQVMIVAINARVSIVKQQVLGALEVTPDTIFFYFAFEGDEPLKHRWVLANRLLPQEEVVAFVAAKMRGDNPLVEAYFASDDCGDYPTDEDVEKSRCFYEYQFRMDEFSKPDELGFSKVLVYPVTNMVGASLITYFVLNQIDYNVGFLDSEIAFLQGSFWEQLGEEISRNFQDMETITWAWWTDYTAPRYVIDGVEITAGITLSWLSVEATRNADPNVVAGELVDVFISQYNDIEKLWGGDGGESPKPPQEPGELFRWISRAVTAVTAGATANREGEEILESCQYLIDKFWYNHDPKLGSLAVMLRGLLYPDEAMPLADAEANAYRQQVRDAKSEIQALERALGHKVDLILFETWLETLPGKTMVVSRLEATSLWELLVKECEPYAEVADYYLYGEESGIERLWKLICDKQERRLEWERPQLDLDFSDNQVVIGGSVADSVKTMLREFQTNGKLLSEGGTARVWITEAYPGLVLKVIEAETNKPELGFEMQDQIGRLAAEWGLSVRVPQVYLGFYDSQGRFCILMERVLGEDLDDLSDSDMPAEFLSFLDGIEAGEFDFIASELADFIANMHAAGYFHADLHLGNVMLVREGNQLFAYIIDYGNSRRRDNVSSEDWEYYVGDDLMHLRALQSVIKKISRRVAARQSP